MNKNRASVIYCLLYVMAICLCVACSKAPTNAAATTSTPSLNTHAIADKLEVPDHCKQGYIPKGDWASAVLDMSNAEKMWVGCSIELLTSRWGAPEKEMKLPGGSTVLVWTKLRNFQSNGVMGDVGCSANITVDQSGKIIGVASSKALDQGYVSYRCGISVDSGPEFER